MFHLSFQIAGFRKREVMGNIAVNKDADETDTEEIQKVKKVSEHSCHSTFENLEDCEIGF